MYRHGKIYVCMLRLKGLRLTRDYGIDNTQLSPELQDVLVNSPRPILLMYLYYSSFCFIYIYMGLY